MHVQKQTQLSHKKFSNRPGFRIESRGDPTHKNGGINPTGIPNFKNFKHKLMLRDISKYEFLKFECAR